MRDKDSDPSASVLDLGEDDLPNFSSTFEAGGSGASDRSDSEADDGHAEQLLYWEVRSRGPCSVGDGERASPHWFAGKRRPQCWLWQGGMLSRGRRCLGGFEVYLLHCAASARLVSVQLLMSCHAVLWCHYLQTGDTMQVMLLY